MIQERSVTKRKSTVTDMTTGEPLGLIIRFFWPLLCGNLFQQMYSMVDTVIVGKGIGDKALASVGACGSINFFIMGFMIGMTSGIGILLSQAFGNGDLLKLKRLVAMSVLACAGLGLTATGISQILIRHYFVMMNTPQDIVAGSLSYFRVILAGIVVTMGNNLCLNILRALGDGKTPLKAMMLSSVINIVLDLFFIMVLETGVAGASLATVIAQFCSILFCFRTIRKLPELHMVKENWQFRPILLKQLVLTGLPVACMNSVTAIGGMTLQFFVNQMGSDSVAAYAACTKITGLSQQPGQAVGLTMLTYVGQNLGARKFDRIRMGVKRGMILSVLVNIPVFILLFFFPKNLAGIMLSDGQIIEKSVQYLPVAGICMFMLGWLFVFRSSCQGMGQTVMPMFSGALEVVMRVSIVVFCGFLPGFYRIVTAEVSAWIAAWLMLMTVYFWLIRKKEQQRTD